MSANKQAPLNAPIADLLVHGGEKGKLTRAAAKLTKRDLLILAAGSSAPSVDKLTVKDLHSITEAFENQRAAVSDLAAAGSCCSSSIVCCCCAASAPVPFQK
jgi:hypothetical protein